MLTTKDCERLFNAIANYGDTYNKMKKEGYQVILTVYKKRVYSYYIGCDYVFNNECMLFDNMENAKENGKRIYGHIFGGYTVLKIA